MKLYYDTSNSATYPQGTYDPSWTGVSAVSSFPKIRSRMDETGIAIIKLRDFEGALKDIWDSRAWTRMKIEDEDSNVIFLGYLTGKTYEAREMTMVISGISKVLQWFPLNNNYILAEGYIDDIAFGADTTRLDLVRGNEARDDFVWAVDKWIDDRDVAIIIRENSTGNTVETWLVTGISQVGGEDIFADPGWEDAPDASYYRIREINETVFNCVLTPVLGGDNIPNTNTISKIEIIYDFKVSWVDFVIGAVWLEVNRNGTWVQVAGAYGGNQWWGATGQRVNGSFELIADDLTDYLTLDGANWDEMLGVRLKFSGDHQAGDGTQTLNLDYIKVEITYNAHNISPILETITNNGASFIQVAGVNWEEMGITDGGDSDGDIFDIGENCKQIVDDIAVACHVNILQLTASTKYMAQHFKGNYGIQILKKVNLLEGWHYWEDFTDGVFGTILVGHLDDLEDSGVDLTQADYGRDWKYEDDPNYYSKVIVYGSAAYRIQQSATAQNVVSPKTKTFYEETITTNAEALAIAEKQLAEWSVKHPSIKLTLKGVHADIKIGTEITLTMVRPTVGEANYPVRMIERERLGHGDIKTTIYAGMGHSEIDEKLTNRINAIMYLAQKSHADRLITTPPGVGVSGVAWGDISDSAAGVEAIIIVQNTHPLGTTDIVIDALILTHKNDNNAHHEVLESLAGDGSPQLGAALDTAGFEINDNTGDNVVWINDGLLVSAGLSVTGNIIVTGTVDGVDILARDHAKYTDGEAQTQAQAVSINNLSEDGSPQLGAALDTAGFEINDNTGDNVVWINDGLLVSGAIAVTGLVDGVDIAGRDHAPTVAGDLNHDDIANPQGNANEQHLTAAQVGALHGDVIVSVANVESVITTQNTHPAGSTDIAIDALILTHKNDNNAHHEVLESLAGDGSPQLGAALDTAGFEINDNTGDNVVWINDGLLVSGAIAVTGLVDGVDIAARDHARYADGEAVSAMGAKADGNPLHHDIAVPRTNLNQIATRNHSDTQNKGVNDHHNEAHTHTHVSTTGRTANDHHTKYTNANAVQAVEDAGIVLSSTKSINIDGTPANQTHTGIVLDIDTTGCATFDAVYVDGANSVAKADATDISKMPAIGIVLSAGHVLVLGVARYDAGWAITAGSKIYVDDTTPGELVGTTAGLQENGNITQIMGVAVGNDMLYINPSLDWVEFVA